MNSELNDLPFETLKKMMGEHSNKVIDSIIKFNEEAKLELTEITDMIKKNIIAFLESKAAIASEYDVGDANGDSYLFENRKLYRENTKKTIAYILSKAQKKTEGVCEGTVAELKALLEKETESEVLPQ